MVGPYIVCGNEADHTRKAHHITRCGVGALSHVISTGPQGVKRGWRLSSITQPIIQSIKSCSLNEIPMEFWTYNLREFPCWQDLVHLVTYWCPRRVMHPDSTCLEPFQSSPYALLLSGSDLHLLFFFLSLALPWLPPLPSPLLPSLPFLPFRFLPFPSLPFPSLPFPSFLLSLSFLL